MKRIDLNRRWVCVLATAVVAGAAYAKTAEASDFPNKPVTLVVPFAAGGSLDVTARIIADRLKDVLGQPVVIANRPGAGSAVGARAVASSAPDGYTLFFTSGSAYGYMHLLVPNYELRLDAFTPIASVASNPSVFAVSAALPVKTLDELVDFSRSQPQGVSFCSTGAGGMNHLQLEMLQRVANGKQRAQMKVEHIPYNGLAPALNGIRSQEVQACALPYTALVKNLDGKELRILAVQRSARLPWLPSLPTTGESGYPELDVNDAFVNVAAPKGTPVAVVTRIETALKQVMSDPAVQKKLSDMDVQPLFMDHLETTKWLKEDVAKFSTIVQEAGLSAKK